MPVILLLLRASWRGVIAAITMGSISGVCSAAAIAMVSQAVGGNIAQASLGTFIGLSLGALGAGIVSQFLLIHLAQDAIQQMRLGLSRQILAAPLATVEQLGPGKILATLTEDVAIVSNTIAVIPFLCIDLALIGSCLVYLASLSGLVFIGTLAIMLASVFLIQGAVGQANRLFFGARNEEDRLLEHFRAITDGIKELKLHWQRRQAFLGQELQTSVAISRDRQVRALRIFSWAAGAGQMIFFATLGVLLFGLPQWFNLPLATLSSYVLTLTYLMMPLQNITQRLPALVRANVALQKIRSLDLTLQENWEATELAPAPVQAVQSLQLRAVSYTYPSTDRPFHLGPIDLDLRGPQVILIVGGNGSGKSTLIKVLLGLYQPDGGELWLNGQRVTAEQREWYRQHFAVVFADFFLFDQLLGLEAEGQTIDHQAAHYLDRLQLTSKVQVNNGRLSTVNLSQGQRKRLALLTAYLEDRPVYVFDEWAADQDPQFRDLFYRELLPALKAQGKLVIAISHDDRYFELADRVVKLDYGQLVADGV